MQNNVQFRRAIKQDAKLRLALCGPSGSGKTYTLLKLATDLGGPVALIDTERGSASKYADLFDFDVLELASFDLVNLMRLLDDAAETGYRVICIDSLSHFWNGKDGELDRVDRISRSSPNSFAAWRQVTPIHNALIDRMISAPLHVLVSMRAKTEWVLERDEKTGKMIPRKVGLAPVMRDGIEYEFDVCGEMNQENTLTITKTRCPRLCGAVFQKPGEDLAAVLKDWLAIEPLKAEPLAVDSPASPPAPRLDNHIEPDTNGSATQNQSPPIPDELAAIWKRMRTPRGVAEEFERLKAAAIKLAGSTGNAEYTRILRECGVKRPREFKSSQPARACLKRIYELVEELRRNARENTLPFDFETVEPADRSAEPAEIGAGGSNDQ
jgi:hypothetical protein